MKLHRTIKIILGLKSVEALRIRPLKDLNELTHHLFECMNTSIYIYYSTNSQQQATDRTSDTGQTGDDNNNNYFSISEIIKFI